MDIFPTEWLIFCILFLCCGIFLHWRKTIGWKRAFLAILCRMAWLSPVVLALYPLSRTIELPRTLSLKPVHVFLDDSASMREGNRGNTLLKKSEALLASLTQSCERLGCRPKVTWLSSLEKETEDGYSPLSKAIPSWMFQVNNQPWVLLSDGGDFQPSLPWSQDLKGMGSAGRGLILEMSPQERAPNVWLADLDLDPFAFADRPILAHVRLGREGFKEAMLVQVQVVLNGKILASVNANFPPNELETTMTLPVPPLPRGNHLLTVQALPLPEEKALWDNIQHRSIEVLPNTVGILHLLGGPSWDGRFLRRYFKAEPKYDLISFFILRDPWDSQQVNERELSLIPFPVARLFNEELANFRVIVLQDFTLLQFLLPEYQTNLVQFVQNGGALFFIGGERALLDMDIQNSPLREILPFDVPMGGKGNSYMTPLMGDLTRDTQNKSGPWYDESLPFKIKLAQPDGPKRSLANVYDEWELLSEAFSQFDAGIGLHHMENVTFREKESTPLLLAQTPQGQEIPLAVASYPGKGRAIWLFSDSFWRLAMSQKPGLPREIYHRFMQGALTWLLRADLKKPLIATSFSIQSGHGGVLWQTHLQGAAVRYFNLHENWQLQVCGTEQKEDQVLITKISEENWMLSGRIATQLEGGQHCQLIVKGTHQAFGEVSAQTESVFPQTYRDEQIPSSHQKLTQLAQLTGARLINSDQNAQSELQNWVEERGGQDGIALPNRFKTEQDYYWLLKTIWFWLLLFAIPCEVLVRRWHHLSIGRIPGKASDSVAP